MLFSANGSPFRLNVGAAGAQRYGDVTALEGGGFVTVWADESAGYGNVIRARMIGADGVPAGTDFVANNPDDAIIQGDPAVSALEGGGFVVVWRNFQTGIYSQRFDAAGKAVGAKLHINDADEAYQSKPAVTAVAGGGYAVAWEGRAEQYGRADVYTQFVTSSNAKAAEVKVNSVGGTYGAQNAAVAKLGTGFVATWQDDSAGNAIKAQVFDAAGAKLGSAITVGAGAVSAMFSTVTALKSGGFAVAWTASDAQGSYSVKTLAFDGNGKPLGQAVAVTAPGTDYVGSPDIAALPDGGFAVSWQNMNYTTYEADVFARSFGADGQPNGTAFRLNSATTGSQTYAEIAANKDGRLFAVWADQNGGDVDIRGQDYKSDFVAANRAPIVNPDPKLRLQDLQLTEDKAFKVVLSDDAFIDRDGDKLHYALTLADGRDLPSWIRFYEGDRSLIVKPPADYNGEVALKMTASDGKASVSDIFKLNVAKVNDAPVLKNPLPDVSVNEGKNWLLKLPKNAFFDADYDNLTVTLSGGGGDSGLTYFANIIGTIAIINGIQIRPNDADFTGPVELTVKVSDGKKSVSDKFVLNVRNVADAPVLSSGPDRDHDGWGDNDGTNASYAIEENSRDVITRFTADDPDPRTKLTYELSGIDAFRFHIDGKGDLRFKNPVDFETPVDKGKDKASTKNNVYDLTVTVSDGKLKDSQAVAVKIEDVKPRTKPGTASANKMTGTTEGDKLDGKGGNDTLTGLGGDDLFVFSTKLDGTMNVDTITDFKNQSGEDDMIGLDVDIFRSLREMGRDTKVADLRDRLHQDDFKVVGGPTDGRIDRTDRILYDRKDGDLYYDRDGSGTDYKPIKFAEIATKADLSWSDFVLA